MASGGASDPDPVQTPDQPQDNRLPTPGRLPPNSRRLAPSRRHRHWPDNRRQGDSTRQPTWVGQWGVVGARQGGVGRELGRELDGSWAGVGRELGGRVARGLASKVGPPGMSAMRVGQCRWSRVGASDPAPTPGQPPSQLPVIPYAVYAVYAVSLPQRHTSEP